MPAQRDSREVMVDVKSHAHQLNQAAAVARPTSRLEQVLAVREWRLSPKPGYGRAPQDRVSREVSQRQPAHIVLIAYHADSWRACARALVTKL